MAVSPLAPTNDSALASTAQQYSPAFLAADALATQHGGSQIPQALRYRQWQAINGDALAKLNPKSAAIAYDTALISDPQTAVAMVKQHNNDPAQMFKARSDYIEGLIAKDPAKYAKVAANWRQGNAALGTQLGLTPAVTQPQNQNANNLKALIDNAAKAAGVNPRRMYGIVAGESGHGNKYDTNISSKEASYGPFQLNRKGGLGNVFERETGLDLRDPSTIPAQAKWVANYLAKNPNMDVGGTWFGYHGDADWNPKWGNAGLGSTELASDQETPKAAQPEQTPVERTGDALSAGISGAIAGQQQAQNEPELKLATPRPNVPLPSGPIAPDQRELYVKALERISKRNAATPQTQAPTPETPQKPEESTEKAAPQSEDKTQNDSEA